MPVTTRLARVDLAAAVAGATSKGNNGCRQILAAGAQREVMERRLRLDGSQAPREHLRLLAPAKFRLHRHEVAHHQVIRFAFQRQPEGALRHLRVAVAMVNYA